MVSRRDTWLAFAAFVLTLAFFIVTLRPDVGGTEDSPKFQFVGEALGTAHSPGYPFYVMATWAFTRLPLGTLAYEVNLFSAVCGALSCMVIFLTARRLGVTRLLSFIAALAAASSYPVWSNSVTAEVYTLAAVLSAGAIYFIIAFAQNGGTWRLYIACALWAAGFGNHLTIVGILPAALIYGVWKDRSVLKPRVAITAAVIGILGVVQYWFIAIRTMQGAPYLEARADTIMGVFDVIIARDVSWARFYQAQSAVAAIEVPMLLNGIRVHMGTIPIIFALIAIGIGIWKKNAEVLVILGAAAGTLGMIANLWGDVVGFITPVCVQLWPLAALGVQMTAEAIEANKRAEQPAGRPAGTTLAAATALAMIVPVTNVVANESKIAVLREPGEGPGVRALYAKLPARSAIVAENYWLARLINYMHYSGEVKPDPDPPVLDSDSNHVKAAIAEGREVFAFEGATHWLIAQGLQFERTDIARQPFPTWLAAQPRGTMIVAATAGRALPFEWLPLSSRSQSRPANYGIVVWTLGENEASVDQNDTGVSVQRVIGKDPRALTISSNDEGPRLMWGDDVMTAIDRGMVVAAFSPKGTLAGQWAFAADETPGVQVPPTPFVFRRELECAVLRPGQSTDVSSILADGTWLATVEGSGKGVITLATSAPASEWRHRLSSGKGDASIDADASKLLLDPIRGTRAIFRFSMPPGQAVAATLEPSDMTAVRVCPAFIPSLPATGAVEVTADRDGWFGSGWHMGERGGSQRFRWSQRASNLTWRMDSAATVRMLLHLRPANSKGATLQVMANGTPLPACTLPAGEWSDCKIEIPATALHSGINQLTLTSDTISPSADRPGDPRELAFVMQASRARIGQ